MHNIITTPEIADLGLGSTTVRQALTCCLIRLSPAVFSVVKRCHEPRHRRLQDYLTDPDWVQLNSKASAGDTAARHQLARTTALARISNYRAYRSEDVVAFGSAALVHALPTFRIPYERVELAHPAVSSKSTFVVRRKRFISSDQIVLVNGRRVTTPERTCADLAAVYSTQAGMAALDHWLRSTVVAELKITPRFGYPAEFAEHVERIKDTVLRPLAAQIPVRGGQLRVLRAVDKATGLAESVAESLCMYNLRLLGIDGVEQQVDITDQAGNFIGRADFYHRESGTIIEVDGLGKYAVNTSERLREEKIRHNRLSKLGLKVIRILFTDLLDLAKFARILRSQTTLCA